MQIPREVPEVSGAGVLREVVEGSGDLLQRVLCGSGRFWCRYLVRFRRVPVQIPREVPEVSGAGTP